MADNNLMNIIATALVQQQDAIHKAVVEAAGVPVAIGPEAMVKWQQDAMTVLNRELNTRTHVAMVTHGFLNNMAKDLSPRVQPVSAVQIRKN